MSNLELDLLLGIKRSQLRWFAHLVKMPSGRFPREVFQVCPAEKRPRAGPGPGGEITSLHWPGNLGSPSHIWLMWPGKGKGKSAAPC